jgi:hypothetical protein
VPLSRNLGTLTSWKPLGHSRPVTGVLYLYLYLGIIRPSGASVQLRCSKLQVGVHLLPQKIIKGMTKWALSISCCYSSGVVFETITLLRCSKIKQLARNRKVNYFVHITVPPKPTLSQMDPIHILRHHLLRTNLILLFHFVLGLSDGVFFRIDLMSPKVY